MAQQTRSTVARSVIASYATQEEAEDAFELLAEYKLPPERFAITTCGGEFAPYPTRRVGWVRTALVGAVAGGVIGGIGVIGGTVGLVIGLCLLTIPGLIVAAILGGVLAPVGDEESAAMASPPGVTVVGRFDLVSDPELAAVALRTLAENGRLESALERG
jgi:hypothetical protein